MQWSREKGLLSLNAGYLFLCVSVSADASARARARVCLMIIFSQACYRKDSESFACLYTINDLPRNINKSSVNIYTDNTTDCVPLNISIISVWSLFWSCFNSSMGGKLACKHQYLQNQINIVSSSPIKHWILACHDKQLYSLRSTFSLILLWHIFFQDLRRNAYIRFIAEKAGKIIDAIPESI